MKTWIVFWNIVLKDIRTYYLKPPNISWGLIFPLAWAGMIFIKTEMKPHEIIGILPGLIAVAVLFGTTSLVAVTITFEKRGRSFERLLLAPVSLELLMFAKTAGAIMFGVVNGFIPVILAASITKLEVFSWLGFLSGIFLLAVSATFMGLLVAVSVSEVFEAQAISNFFRFPMIFLCGFFYPVSKLPDILRILSYILPPTYGVDILRWSITHVADMDITLDFTILILFCIFLFLLSLKIIRRRWIS
jgi:ABC-2 type transport system permease protein